MSSLASSQAPFDLLLKGGHLIDPKNRIDGLLDVAVHDGKVAEIAADIDPGRYPGSAGDGTAR